MPPTNSLSDIADLIRSQCASYQLEDVSEDIYCKGVDPKKSKHCQLLTFSDFLLRLVVRTLHHVYHAFFFLSRRSKDMLLWFTFFDSCLLTKIGENNTGDNDLLADIQPVLTLLWCSIMLLMWTFILFCVYRNAQTILLAICFWRLWPGGGQGRVV